MDDKTFQAETGSGPGGHCLDPTPAGVPSVVDNTIGSGADGFLHELGNVTTVLQLVIQNLRRSADDPASFREALVTLQKVSSNLDELIRNIKNTAYQYPR
jgi:hypothetical protein